MLRWLPIAFAALLAPPVAAAAEVSVELRGSPASMIRQHSVAKSNDYTFLRTDADVRRFVANGYLVPVEGNADYELLPDISYPYARPELRLFIERLAAQHREACGERLVVTSLTRPMTKQPGNSHQLSVHPAGMAVDLRVLKNAGCRSWLEGTLLSLEEKGLLDATREQRPPHYHVALFPNAYREYAAPLIAADSARAEAERLAREQAEAEAIAKLAAASSRMDAAGAEQPVRTAGAGDLRPLFAVPAVLGLLGLGILRGRLPAPVRLPGRKRRDEG